MTDNEIIKALEGCSCDTLELALDLINRQKSKIDSLENSLESMRSVANGYKSAYEREKGKSITAVQDFAERLKEKADYCYLGSFTRLAYQVEAKDLDNLVKELTGAQQ